MFRKLAWLYHGTSLARKKSIQKKGLVFNIPKVYRKTQLFDKRISLTSNLETAKMYAIKTVLMEKKLTPKERKKLGLTKHRNIGIVLQINVKNLDLKKLIPDPEEIPEVKNVKCLFLDVGKVIPPSFIDIKEISLSKQEKAVEYLECDIKVGLAWEKGDHVKFVEANIEFVKLLYDNEDEQKQFLSKELLENIKNQESAYDPEQKKKYANFYSLVKAELENKGYVDRN